jgi:hypothetical protein
VRRLLRVLIGVVCLAIAGYATGSALAQGTNTSAGDQQYIDPLTSTTSTSSKSPTTQQPTSSGSSSATGSSSTGSSSSPTTTTAAAPPAGNTPASGATLPYTGLNVGVLIGVGLALLGGGVLLRLFLRRA